MNVREKIKNWHIIPKIACVFCAFIIWLYVMEVDSPDYTAEFGDVEVKLSGVSALESGYNLSVFSGYDTTVDVSVKGQKSVISRYSSSDINVTADVSDITESGKYTLDLFFDLPSGLTLEKSSLSQINLYVDERASKAIDVRSKLTSVTIPENCELGDLTADSEYVTVTGPKGALDEVDHALVSLDAGSIESSVTMVGEVSLISVSGDVIVNPYLRLSKSDMKVTVPVYTYKEITLAADSKYGFFNSDNTRITIDPPQVTVKGDPNVLSKLDELTITTLDEKNIKSDSTLMVKLNLPDNVTLADGEPSSVNVRVQRIGCATRSLTVKNIELTGTQGMDCTLLTTALSVTVVGDEKSVQALSADDITLVADLSDHIAAGSDLLYAAATVKIDSESGEVYELGTYSIQVRIED